MTASGKVQKFTLRKLAMQELQLSEITDADSRKRLWYNAPGCSIPQEGKASPQSTRYQGLGKTVLG